MRVTSKGQVTIPIEIREKLGILPETEVEFVLKGGRAYIVKAGTPGKRGRRIVEHLRGRARGSRIRLSTDEIMALTRGD